MSKKHIEVAVSPEVIRQAIAEIAPHVEILAKRNFFDGDEKQKIMGRIGEKVAARYLEITDEEVAKINFDGNPDKGDYDQLGWTFDVKTSFSYEYRDRGKVPSDWGLLIPDSQFRFCPHDFYIRCAVDSNDPEEITRLCFVGVCMKKAVAELADVRNVTCKQPREVIVLMRIVPELYTFSIDELKRYLEAKKGEQCQ